MSVPREKVRQIDCGGKIKLIGQDSGEDWSDRMDRWCTKVLPGLESEKLSGFVFRSRSPSCALRQSTIFSTTGKPPKKGPGFFASRAIKMFPLFPVEASERLHNPLLRENFIRRVFVFSRWQRLESKGKKIGELVDFHNRHKMIIRSHDLRGYRQLGKLFGESSVFNNEEIFDAYSSLLFKSLSLKATPKKNAEVLKHALRFIQKDLPKDDSSELLGMINAYKSGRIPLLVPITIINHYARKLDQSYLRQQYFLNPHPSELKLLNHV